MPISLGVTGYDLPQHERVSMLITAVGGPVKASALTGRSRGTIDNMRKPGAVLRVDDMLALAEEAGVSLDWIATGYQVRPDLMQKTAPPIVTGLREETAPEERKAADLQRLLPLRPQLRKDRDGGTIERWAPSEIAVEADWLEKRGMSIDTARYAYVGDAGMAPLISRDALVIVDIRPAPFRAGLYLVGAGEELLARRLNRLPDGRSELVADALPTWHFSIPLEGHNDLVLHRIIWCGQDV